MGLFNSMVLGIIYSFIIGIIFVTLSFILYGHIISFYSLNDILERLIIVGGLISMFVGLFIEG